MNPEIATNQSVPSDPMARAKLELLCRFSSTLAHDLRTPLMVIRIAAETIRKDPNSSPRIAEALAMIDDGVKESDQILANLLEIGHGCELTLTEVDLEPLLSEVVAQVDPKRCLTWRFDIPPGRTLIWADRPRFAQVLLKLFQNALCAVQGRGEVTVAHRTENDRHLIDVRDTGPGVPPHLRETLFDPFVTTKGTGMGLGLTYCREVIKRHGGSIRLVEPSAPGAAFQILLPRNKPPSAEMGPDGRPRSGS